jgi:hypothetical protein
LTPSSRYDIYVPIVSPSRRRMAALRWDKRFGELTDRVLESVFGARRLL